MERIRLQHGAGARLAGGPMMVNTAVSPNESLAAVLSSRARAASDGRLILDIAVGLLVALAVTIWHPRGWIVPLNIGIAFAAFGAWGLADRELAERVGDPGDRLVRGLRVLRVLAAVVGGLAATVACFALLGLALGNWIS
ncbi:MAG: hypothetical protein ACHQSE_15520 [Gemmatimonadales bacterium]